MEFVNYPHTSKAVVSSHDIIIDELVRQMKLEVENLNHVYAPADMSFQSVIKLFREESKRVVGQTSNMYPIMAYNYSVMRPAEKSIAKRFGFQKVTVTDPDNPDIKNIMRFFLGDFDMEFTFFFSNMDEMNRFQIAYNSEHGISGVRKLIVNMPDLGEFEYKIVWSTLEAMQVADHQEDGNTFFSVSGRLMITGLFFIREGQSAIIKTIKTTINTDKLENLANIQISD